MQRQDPVQRVRPLGVRELRQAEDEVEAEVAHARFPQDADGLCRPGAVVPPAHPAQDPVVHRLHAHADAVHAQLQQGADVCAAPGYDVFRIDFYGEFLVGTGIQSAHDALQLRDVQHGRGPAADVEGPQAQCRLDLSASPVDLPAHAVRKKFLRPGGLIRRTDLRIEVAVGAETFAEGDVQVDHPPARKLI